MGNFSVFPIFSNTFAIKKQTSTAGQDGVTGTRFTLFLYEQVNQANKKQFLVIGQQQCRIMISERRKTKKVSPINAPASSLGSFQATAQ